LHSPIGKSAKARVEQLRIATPDSFAFNTDQEYLDEIRLLSQEGDITKAEAFALQFATKFPTSPLRPEMLSVLAPLYKRQGRGEEAIATWKEITDRYSTSAVAPAAFYEWAALLWNKDRDDEASVVF
jgi:hypothetical protein